MADDPALRVRGEPPPGDPGHYLVPVVAPGEEIQAIHTVASAVSTARRTNRPMEVLMS